MEAMERKIDFDDVMVDIEMIEQTARIIEDIATSNNGRGDGRSLACDKMFTHAAHVILETANRIRKGLNSPVQVEG